MNLVICPMQVIRLSKITETPAGKARQREIITSSKNKASPGILPPLRKQVTGLEDGSTWFFQWFKVEVTADFVIDETSGCLSEQ